jgi:D-3-phosphoglycerate dehydrogenase
MLALSRSVAPAFEALRGGKWDRKSFTGTQLAGKTLGIVGLGRIGQEVAKRARAFEMRVLGYDPYLSPERARELGVETCDSVRGMLPRVDYLTVHTPLTKETENLVSFDELELLKPGARLINCARGGIYNEQALVQGLKSGKLGGVALDVFADEPCTNSPLFGMKGVLCTPHLGASTEEAQAEVAREAAELIIAFLSTGAVRHAVNMTPLDAKQLAGLRPTLGLAWRLGLLMAGWREGVPTACRLNYRGEVAKQDTKLVTAAFAAGLLEGALAGDVNIVNAEMLLRERGIDLVEESREEMGAFRNLITAELTTGWHAQSAAIGVSAGDTPFADSGRATQHHTYRAAATTFGRKMLRLVQLGDYRLDSFLDGILVIFHHRDVPGIIGAVGTIFGRHRVNIAQMGVGRAGNAPGGDAIGVLNVDSEPPQAAVQEVLAHPDITAVKVIHLPAAGEMPAWLGG